MAFSRNDVDALLVQCHRCCCICHRFCGVKIETDHITPKADNGPDTIDNAIPVCFECHAEIHSYNDRHPRGRKFRPEELQCHKEQWLKVCQERPDLLLTARKNADVGPLQALIDELDFNARVALYSDEDQQGCLFERTQFRRAVSEGAISALDEKLRDAVLDGIRWYWSCQSAYLVSDEATAQK